METFQVIILAIIQGFTEFLPISSSGHLILPKEIWGWDDQGLAFDVAVHMGTLIAVVSYFYRDILELIKAWFVSLSGQASVESKLAWFVIWATVPAGLAGLIFHDFIEQNLRSITVVALTTVIFGLLLGLADWRGNHQTSLKDMSFKQAMLVGLSQALALIPGTSRSGITITAALALGMERQAAARFSFLLSIPIITLSGGYQAIKLLEETFIPWADLGLATVVAALTAFICIHGFLQLINKVGMWPFVVYRLILGAWLFSLI